MCCWSFAASLDGALDDASPERLLLSKDAADFDRVDAENRAESDAILVGAGTVRADNRTAAGALRRAPGRPGRPGPRAESAARSRAPRRLAAGVDPQAAVLTEPGAETVVVYEGRRDIWPKCSTICMSGAFAGLMVEGGSAVLTEFLASDLADEIQVAYAPFLIGEAAAPSPRLRTARRGEQPAVSRSAG